jgi:hypothetical protein
MPDDQKDGRLYRLTTVLADGTEVAILDNVLLRSTQVRECDKCVSPGGASDVQADGSP